MTTDKERATLRRLLKHRIEAGTGGPSDKIALSVLEERDALAAYSEAMAKAARDAYADSGFEDWNDKNSPDACLASRDAGNRELGMLQGACVAAAMVAPWQEVMAREILTAFGVRSGDDLDGCAEYDLAELIKNHVRIPGLHAAWLKARRQERRQADQFEGGSE